MRDFVCVNCEKELNRRACSCETQCGQCGTKYHIDSDGNVTISKTKIAVPSTESK